MKWGPFVQGDLLDKNKLKQTFTEYDFAGVIHFAAKAYVEESVKNPIKYFEENITTTINLMETMQASGVSNLVFSSSCTVYGPSDSLNISETEMQVPINPYGFSKLTCEKLIEFVGASHQMKFANLRFFNAAGADSAGEIGESHDPETHLIPRVLRSAITKSTFQVYGGDYPTRDGSAIRDFIHVSDLAAAHVRAIKILIAGGDSFVCNLGTGKGFSVLEIMREILLIFPDFKYSIEDRRMGDAPRLVANIDLSKKILNLSLANSSLKNILRTSLNWELKKSDSYS